MVSEKPCVNCEGTGKALVSNSWIVSDGYRRERCGVCGGSGINPPGYTAWAGNAAFQKQARENISKWGGLLRPPINWD